ncbi:MAG: fumarate hydratase, partial [Candidatus Bathyarchaeota archaeon]
MNIDIKVLEETGLQLLKESAIRLPPPVRKTIRDAFERETSTVGKKELKNILDNIELAEKLSKPICQDTGIISFFIKSREISNYRAIN